MSAIIVQNLTQAEDEVKSDTVFTPHEEDKNSRKSNKEENAISIEALMIMGSRMLILISTV